MGEVEERRLECFNVFCFVILFVDLVDCQPLDVLGHQNIVSSLDPNSMSHSSPVLIVICETRIVAFTVE